MTVVEYLLVTLTVAVCLALYLPVLLGLVGLGTFSTAIMGTHLEMRPDGSDGHYDDAYSQLVDLGFEPIGIFVERAWFLFGHWCKESGPVRVFASSQHRCFAIAYRPTKKLEFGLQTLFADDTQLFTTTSSTKVPQRKDYIRRHVATDDMKTLLGEHLQAVDEQQTQGKAVRDDLSLQTACYANELENKGFRWLSMQTALVYLQLVWMSVGFTAVGLLAVIPKFGNGLVYLTTVAMLAAVLGRIWIILFEYLGSF